MGKCRILSRASHDLHDKLNAYRGSGMNVIWRVYDRAIDWFFGMAATNAWLSTPTRITGVRFSQALWLDAAALLRGDMAQVLQVLQLGMATPEYAAFKTRLHNFTSN
jgi:hypothetical protein